MTHHEREFMKHEQSFMTKEKVKLGLLNLTGQTHLFPILPKSKDSKIIALRSLGVKKHIFDPKTSQYSKPLIQIGSISDTPMSLESKQLCM